MENYNVSKKAWERKEKSEKILILKEIPYNCLC